MKRLLYFALSVTLCLSLFSCGTTSSQNGTTSSKNKFVGTYENESSRFIYVNYPYRGNNTMSSQEAISGKYTLQLNSDGTGSETFEITNIDPSYTIIDLEKEKKMWTKEITWTADEQYINITFKGVTYYLPDNDYAWSDTPREISSTYTYELKGVQLIDIESERSAYTKIS